MPSNKPFKKKKSAQATGGRNVKDRAGVKARKLQSNASRSQSLAALRGNKRAASLDARRSTRDPPKIVAFVPLTDAVDTVGLRNEIAKQAGQDPGPAHAPVTVALDAFKMKGRFTLFCPAMEPLAVMDIVKVADIVVWCCSADQECDPITPFGEHCIKLVKAQGVPACLGSLQMRSPNPKPAAVVAARRDYEKWLHFHFADKPRVVPVSGEADVGQLARFLLSLRLKAVPWRDMYPYTLAHSVNAQKHPQDEPGRCTMLVSGYMTGAHGFDVNGLVHLTGVGTFALRGIEAAAPPTAQCKSTEMQEEAVTLKLFPNEQQESLISENPVDEMAGEQTWPTEEELQEADQRNASKKKMVPKGTSSYQAAWYLDPEDQEEEEEEDDGEDWEMGTMGEEADMMEDASEDDMEEADEEELEELQDQEQDGEDMDDEAREEELRRWREAKTDAEFPDERDTPEHVSARVQFQKYRALSSFRKAHWDPKESLPLDYSKIFQLHNLKRAKKLALAGHAEAASTQGIELGAYVTVAVANVPESFVSSCGTRTLPLICVGLHRHENKMSLVNMKLKRSETGFADPIKSKTELEFHVGFMRFVASAVFSTESRGTVSDKHKLERFWQHDSGYTIASVFAPIKYPPAPVLAFLAPDVANPAMSCHQPESFVASGQVESVNADRIVLKRLVLSGAPFRVHKSTSTVRFMFFDPQDILWFKKAPLWTKYGKVGNIRESLGTHGYMKCVFNQPIQQHDTVCMSLYKRVFPKWRSDIMNTQF